MTTKYRVFKFVFDIEAFALALETISKSDIHTFAGVIGVDVSTLQNWRNGTYARSKFPNPTLTNLLACCNALDLDPRSFFVLQVQGE